MRSLSWVRRGGSWKPIDPLFAFTQQSRYKRAWEFISETSGGRGKIYWFAGTKDDLLLHWKRDFSG